jgi:hypothetical protein
MKTITLLFCFFSYTTISAQLFTPAFDLFSNKEVAYIHLEDGTKVEGIIHSVNKTNGLIKSISITPTGETKRISLKADAISSMYLPVSSFNKFDNAVNSAFNEHVRGRRVNTDIINKGYAYFEKTKVVKKKEVEDQLLQLLNPSFSEKIRVYDIPLSKETTSTELGGVTIALDENKSYFVKVGEATAVKLRKKDYDEAYAALYKDCPALVQKLKNDHRWSRFDEHLWEYSTKCN